MEWDGEMVQLSEGYLRVWCVTERDIVAIPRVEFLGRGSCVPPGYCS